MHYDHDTVMLSLCKSYICVTTCAPPYPHFLSLCKKKSSIPSHLEKVQIADFFFSQIIPSECVRDFSCIYIYIKVGT